MLNSLKIKKIKKGFTLVEMLIVVAAFSILITAVIGVFVSSIRTQRYTLASQELLNQTSYAVEYMSRLVRMAKKDINADCLATPTDNFEETTMGDDDGLKFLSYHEEGRCLEFFLDNGQVKERRTIIGIGTEDLPLTSENLEVTSLKFYVSGESQSDNYQPRITIVLKARVKNLEESPEIELQTSVSQRNLDIAF